MPILSTTESSQIIPRIFMRVYSTLRIACCQRCHGLLSRVLFMRSKAQLFMQATHYISSLSRR